MKLKLAYDKTIELPNNLSFKDRSNYIMENVFENNNYLSKQEKITYKSYYNLNSTDLPENVIVNIKKRWIGIKRVNMQYPDDTFKKTVDFLSTYLINSKEYSNKHKIHEYIQLKRKQIQKKANDDEISAINTLEKNIFYAKIGKSGQEVVFYINNAYERMLNQRIKKIKKIIKVNDNVDSDLINTYNRLIFTKKQINNLKKQVKVKKGKIMEQRELLKITKQKIRDAYKTQTITTELKHVKVIKQQISFIENEIKNLVDDYMTITELMVSIYK